MKLMRDMVRRFETFIADYHESLMRASLAEPGNPEGYAFYRDGTIRPTCSTNSRAGWATCAYSLNQQPADRVRRAMAFFMEHSATPRALIARRIADARDLGCFVLFGGADFESPSRANQMARGLTVAYTAAWWSAGGL